MVRTQVAVPQLSMRDTSLRVQATSSPVKRFIKRLFDILMSILGIMFLSPFLALLSILIKKDSPGPIFYWGMRAGLNGRPFKILKFRTMYERPESYAGPRVTADGDERITPLGSWLRYTKINELPQLWNVLVGEMSLVGPRPEDVEIARNWPEDASREILSVRPGVTSPASILYHDEEKLLTKGNLMEDYFQSILPNKMRLDRLYVRYHSFSTDLDIIFWTIAILIPRLTSAKIPEGYLFAGPFSRFVHRYANWFLIDLVVAGCAVAAACLLWFPQAPDGWELQALSALIFLIAILFNSVNTLSGLNRILWARSTSEDGMELLLSGGVTSFFVLIICESRLFSDWLGFPLFPISMVTLASTLSVFGFILARYRLRLLSAFANRWLNLRQNKLAIGERVLLIGTGEGSQIASWLLKRRMFRTAFSIVGLVDEDDPTMHGLRIGGYSVLGGLLDLPAIVKKQDIGVILSTIPADNPKTDEYIFDICRETGLRLVFLDDLLRLVDKQVTQPSHHPDQPAWRADHLEFKAIHDLTTQLPNRYLLQERLRHSLAYSRRYHTSVSILFIDLDGLAPINNILGHKYGDEVLVQVARQLMQCKRDSDSLARTGDHQFTLILEHLGGQDETEKIARRVLGALFKPIQIHGRWFNIEPGISVCKDGALLDSNDLELAACYQKRLPLEVKTAHEHNVAA